MKTRGILALISVVVLILLQACGSPQATLRTTATPITKWKKISADNVEISLPDNYIGGDVATDLDIIVGKLGEFGSKYQSKIDALKENQSLFKIYAFDPVIGDSGYLTSAIIYYLDMGSKTTLDACTEASLNGRPSSWKIINQKDVQLGQYEAKQATLELTEKSVTASILSYYIEHGNICYIITYVTAKEEFDDRLPVFEQSANTFNILH